MPSFVSFIPTERELIQGFFELAPVSTKDIVYDLGCGDGRLLFAAIEKGAGKAVGIELNANLVEEGREEVNKRGLENKVSFICGDVLDVRLSEATVIFCYLIGEAAYVLRTKFESELKTGIRIVMEMFPIPSWKPEQTYVIQHGSGSGYREFYLYVMPPEYVSD